MDTSRYATRDDAVEHLIIKPIEAGSVALAEDYDIDAIAAIVLRFADIGTARAGFEMAVDEIRFWEVVADHALPR